jgi:uncharacterized protein YdeI (YjbR/CyaY-like superfamily)
VAKVEALTAAGRMRPRGLAEVEAAKADGRWAAAYESQRTAAVPADLAAALAGDGLANAAFERLGRSDRYAVILPLLKPAHRRHARGSCPRGRAAGRSGVGRAHPSSSEVDGPYSRSTCATRTR